MNRLHIHLKVDDLDHSIRFYEAMLGQPPTQRETDYAKWLIDEPRAHISLSTHCADRTIQGIDHAGIAFANDETLTEASQRLSDAGFDLQREEATTCCYAQSNKTWARAPEGASWELFHTYDTSSTYGSEPERSAVAAITPPKQPTCCPR